uniref:Uncharacterized protein n=1 Tax=Glossina palpalis gambiensis TaxID=67801 RepID=A0A1B0B642_9MUSC
MAVIRFTLTQPQTGLVSYFARICSKAAQTFIIKAGPIRLEISRKILNLNSDRNSDWRDRRKRREEMDEACAPVSKYFRSPPPPPPPPHIISGKNISIRVVVMFIKGSFANANNLNVSMENCGVLSGNLISVDNGPIAVQSFTHK